jgi:hypothetical protein
MLESYSLILRDKQESGIYAITLSNLYGLPSNSSW